MRCRLCRDRTGWFRRKCSDCRRLLAIWQEHRGSGMRGLLAQFAESAVSEDKIERFLNAEPTPGGGTIRDQIAADMTNQLLHALGQEGKQTSSGVKRLRERGQWKGFDRPPPE